MLFTCIKSWFFRNHLANFHQISHWSFCWNVIDSLFKWSCSIDCQAHIFFFKTKNCSNDDIFISCDERIGKMLHNICMSAVAMSLRWANRGPWASCYLFYFIYLFFFFLFIFFENDFEYFNEKRDNTRNVSLCSIPQDPFLYEFYNSAIITQYMITVRQRNVMLTILKRI